MTFHSFSNRARPQDLRPESRLAPTDEAESPAIGQNRTSSSFWLVLAVVGLVGYFLVARPLIKAHTTTSWLSTTGKVVRSSYASYRTYGRVRIKWYSPAIEYQYRAPGQSQQYTSTKVSINGLDFASQQRVKEFLEHYQPGATVRVYYNPTNPAESALVTGIPRRDSVIHWILEYAAFILFFLFHLVSGIGNRTADK